MEESAAKHNCSNEDTESDISELTYDYAWRSLDRAANHLERVDNKVATLGGFIGVMATVLITLLPTAFLNGEFLVGFALMSQILFCISIILLLCSLVACLTALNPRSMFDWPLTKECINVHLSKPVGEQNATCIRQVFTNTFSQVDQSYMNAIHNKVKHFKLAILIFSLAIFTLTAAGGSAASHLLLKTYEPAANK